MTTTATTLSRDVISDRRVPMAALNDTLAIAWRNVIAYRRVPQLLVFSTRLAEAPFDKQDGFWP